MAGTIATSFLNKGNLQVSGYSPIYYNPAAETSQSLTVCRKSYVDESQFRDRLSSFADFEISKNPNKRPNHFYHQQPRLLQYIPPTHNTVYKLDTGEVPINMVTSVFSRGDRPHEEHYSLRDNRLVDVSAPTPSLTGKVAPVEKYARGEALSEWRDTLQTSFMVPAKYQVSDTRGYMEIEMPHIETVDYTRRRIPPGTLLKPNALPYTRDSLEMRCDLPQQGAKRSNFFFKTI